MVDCKAIHCRFISGKLVKYLDETFFYSQQSHLSCCRSSVLAALMQGKDFALIAETFAVISADADYHLQLPRRTAQILRS